MLRGGEGQKRGRAGKERGRAGKERMVEQGRREVEQGRGEEDGKGEGGKKKMKKRRYCSVLHNISSLYRRL